IEIDVLPGKAQPAARIEHGEHHGEPSRIPAHHGPARRAERALRDERLDLDEHGPRALDAREDRAAARLAVALAEKEGGRVRHFGKTHLAHFEDADFVRGSEAVFHRAQDAELVSPLALEIENAIDHVLDDARARDLAVLRHMA